jgi:hypothetical protein
MVFALSAIAYVGARRHSQNMKATDTFAADARLGYWLVALALLMSALPLLPPSLGGHIHMGLSWMLIVPASLCPAAIAASYFCYRVVVTETAIIAGVFHPRTFPFF